jgi:hypothetical protein
VALCDAAGRRSPGFVGALQRRQLDVR